jgi:hypothetical protein
MLVQLELLEYLGEALGGHSRILREGRLFSCQALKPAHQTPALKATCSRRQNPA